MRKVLAIFLAATLCLFCLPPVFAAMPFAPQKIIAVHIGPKNASFDESPFPDIEFYYTPNIKWTTDKTTGTPAILAEWLNKSGLRLDEAIVIDKDGIVAFKNILMRNKRIEDAFSQGDMDSLGNVLRNVMEQNRKAPYVSSKPFSTDDVSMIGKRMPDFPLISSSGEATTMGSLVGTDLLPAMVFFFRIPPTYKFGDVEETMGDARSPLEVLGAITSMSQGEEYTSLLERMETELYGR